VVQLRNYQKTENFPYEVSDIPDWRNYRIRTIDWKKKKKIITSHIIMTIHITLNIMNIQSIKDKDTNSLQRGKKGHI